MENAIEGIKKTNIALRKQIARHSSFDHRPSERKGSLWNAAVLIALVATQGRADGWWGEMSSVNLISLIVMTFPSMNISRDETKSVYQSSSSAFRGKVVYRCTCIERSEKK
ncbi:hypothetical protein TNCT_680161 [Trichonephila clavata]|uniref:Uncharacterized protein n=1 Tax=Trichonephila clavata TaxID=2740835 RepID=A0A8X6GTB3_TRICU|nr:hypothetical protein TNCT_680161 [Trichonephila clavata]